MKLFQLPKYDENVSKCSQFLMKWLHIIRIGMKLFEVPQKWKSCLKLPFKLPEIDLNQGIIAQ